MEEVHNKVRLQKIIADCGLASRRQTEVWIAEGRVTVNGRKATLGEKADPKQDVIKVSGKVIPKTAQSKITLAMNKPKGLICSHSDPFHAKTIFDILPKKYQRTKLACAGRLDKESEGLVILTSDGDLAYKIAHPSLEIVKRYQVTLSKPFDEKLIPKLLKGIKDEGEHLHADKIILKKVGVNATSNKLEVHLKQGHKREIRRLFEAFGYYVKRLNRFQIGKFSLRKLPKGTVKQLNAQEIDLLLKK